ncbi:UNVERIFIED_CONTAM: protein SRC2 [Sesamum calycinum]|uniref:Protein SRC2 n=1 Tax=Sesamum calycinum TaxID=2727403 RepID=A0AAW2PM42_9LAMI
MEYRPLNITVVSAEDLKDVKVFSKMDVYTEVSIAGYPLSKKKTFVDKNSGTNPKWNHRMEFIVDEPYLTKPGLSLLFEIKAESTFSGHKDIGSVTVPIYELYQPDATEDKVVEYQVHTRSGKPKGTLKFSYRFGEKFTQQMEAKHIADEPTGGYGHQAPPPFGYQPPPPAAQPQKPKKGKKGGMGMGGLGLGLGAGLLGGLLVGEMVDDIGDAAAYADGYGDAMDDVGFGF